MPGFPLFRIPLLARIEILKHVDVYDLITLTFCSERTRALVESANIPLRELSFKLLGSDGVDIYVNDFFMKTLFTPIKDCQCKEAHKFVEVLWEDYPNCKIVVLFRSASVHDSLEKILTDHLMRTFRNVKVVNVCSFRTGAQNFPVWKFKKTINNFSYFPQEKLSEEEMTFLLQELTINRNLNIYSPVVDLFKFSTGFQSEKVQIEHANWVHFDAILNSKSQEISLYGIEKPSAVQLNTMLKLWMSMEIMENLELMSLKWPAGNYSPITFLTEVLDGIVHVRHNYQFAEMRRIDGKIANVSVSGNRRISFGAWFPSS